MQPPQRRTSIYIIVAASCIALPVSFEWVTTPPSAQKTIHIETFRYGTSPSIIRANRGDQLTLTFSTLDTAHSVLLQDYRVEVKVPPASETVEVVDPLRATEQPLRVPALSLTAGKPGLWGSLASVSRYRCHIYCGPMHGFEQGDLIVRPNFLLSGSLGLLVALIVIAFLRVRWEPDPHQRAIPPAIDINARWPWVGRLLRWRPLQFVGTVPMLAGLTLIVLAGLFGTKVGGRNIAVMMTWAVWMSVLAVVLVHLNPRIWCLVCPLPAMGEFLQRGALTQVRSAETRGRFGNRFFWLGRPWPRRLRGPWLRLVLFVALSSLAASFAGQPRWTASLLLSFAVIGIVTSVVWELRAFCRYVCPAAAFISLYSAIARLTVRCRNAASCHDCAGRPCVRGNEHGWACPYGQSVPSLTHSAECGVCTECFKSCPRDNVALPWRRGPPTLRFTTYGEAWAAITLLLLAAIYSLTLHAPWPAVRDMINVVDKATLPEFGIYAASVSVLALGVAPVLFWLAVRLGVLVTDGANRTVGATTPCAGSTSGTDGNPATGARFKHTMPAVIPLGLGLWAAFFIAIAMTNFTFILYTLSDPFG